MFKRRKTKPIYGEEVPEPRITSTGRALLVFLIGLPLLAVLLLLDVFIWAAVKSAFDVCVGIWCVF